MATLAVRNNNPGNLKDPSTGTFRQFPNPQAGELALESDLNAKVTGHTSTGLTPDSSLYDFATKYAPASDNNDPVSYAKNLASQLGVTVDTPLSKLQGRIHDFAGAVAHNEDSSAPALGKAPTQSLAADNVGQLSHEQMIANINAMEQQGAQPQEIQEYLNSLKPSTNTNSGGLPQAPQAPAPLLSAQDDLAASGPQAQPDNLGTDLSKRVQEGTQAATEGLSAAAQGNIHGAASGLLQTVGAGAGAIGDVVNRGLELVPGVKQIEGLIGQGVGKLAETAPGQAIVKSVKDFSEKNPELSKDIGAGFNILTAIPILRGLGAVKDVALDAASQGLKSAAEKSTLDGLTNVVNSTKTGSRAFAKNPEAIKTLIDERALPDIKDGEYTTKEASAKLDEAISHIEDNELQPELAKGNSPAVSARLPFSDVLKAAEAEATDSQEAFGPIKNELELIQKKYGDYLTLKQLNDAKRVVAHKISQAAYGSPDSSAMKVARSVLQKSVEEGANKLGLADAGAINAKMRRLIQAQDMLQYIDKKGVKTGMLGSALKDVATGAGEMAGNATGIPLAGAFVGRGVGGNVGKKIAGLRLGVLNRTGKDAVRTPLKKAGKKVIGGILGAEAQKATKSP